MGSALLRSGATPEWRRIRRAVLAAKPPYCATCGVHLPHPGLIDVGHIQDRARGGDDSPGNLQIQCRKCNRVAGARLGGLRTRARRVVLMAEPGRLFP